MAHDIDLALIDPDPEQPRRHFDQARLDELAQSMAANGLAVAVLVRPVADGRYMLVHGERRWRAAQQLGWPAIRAEVQDLTPEQARWLALVENVQRADLSPIEEAQAYQVALADGLTQTELGQRIGKSQSYVAQKLRLLTLPAPLQFYLDQRAISEGHARQLLRLRNFYGPELMSIMTVEDSNLGQTDWTDPAMIFALLVACRPLDHPVIFVDGLANNESPELLVKATQSFVDWLASDGKVPQWTVAAFWYASLVVLQKVSVYNFGKLLDGFEDQIYSAIVYLNSHPKPPQLPQQADEDRLMPVGKRHMPQVELTPRQRLDVYYYWGHLSDLRHAGCNDWRENAPTSVYLKATNSTIGQNKSLALPSSCQAWGPLFDEVKELRAQIEYGSFEYDT